MSSGLSETQLKQVAVAIAAGLCKRFEGVYLKPYLCPRGVPTIGVGATYYEDGKRVTLADPAITLERAMALLSWHIEDVYLPAVLALCPRVDTPKRLGALTDFCLNVGSGNLRISTLRKYVNAGLWDRVPAELMKWCKAGGVVYRGLLYRRKAEADLI